MIKDRLAAPDYSNRLQRLLLVVVCLCMIVIFLVWRIDSPRVERLRAEVTDRIVGQLDWAMTPINGAVRLLRSAQSYSALAQQNDELRRELRRMRAWKEAAIQLGQENARLLDLTNVHLDPRLTHVTGVVLADSGSPFRQSVLINVGKQDGILEGWATMDGIGLVGRISGVARNTSRVMLMTDASSRVPGIIQPSGQHVIISGNNSATPFIDFIENPNLVRPGDRIFSTGDGGVFPPGLLIGSVAKDPGGRLHVQLAADYTRLEFLRVLRYYGTETVPDSAQVIASQSPGPRNE